MSSKLALSALALSPALLFGTALAHPLHHRHHHCHCEPHHPPESIVSENALERMTILSPVKLREKTLPHIVDAMAADLHASVSLPTLSDTETNTNAALLKEGIVFNNTTPEQVVKELSKLARGHKVNKALTYLTFAPVGPDGIPKGRYISHDAYAWSVDYSFGKIVAVNTAENQGGEGNWVFAGNYLDGHLDVRENSTFVRLVDMGHHKYKAILISLKPVKTILRLGPHPFGPHHFGPPPEAGHGPEDFHPHHHFGPPPLEDGPDENPRHRHHGCDMPPPPPPPPAPYDNE